MYTLIIGGGIYLFVNGVARGDVGTRGSMVEITFEIVGSSTSSYSDLVV